MPANRLLASVVTDRSGRPHTRQARESVELYALPLRYGDLSEAGMTVWADGRVRVAVKDATGKQVAEWSYDPAASQ